MKVIAAMLGVSGATVSKAYAGDTEIPDATRQRVLEAGKALGYVPDPVLGALTKRRWRKSANAESAVIMSIWRDRADFLKAQPAYYVDKQFQKGLAEEAQKLGYVYSEIWEKAFRDAEGLTRHLESRGVAAIIAQGSQPFHRMVDFDRFYHVLDIGEEAASDLNQLRFDWGAAVTLVSDKLRAREVRKWGFVMNDIINPLERRELMSSILYASYYTLQNKAKEPLLIVKMEGDTFEETAKNVRETLFKWLDGNKGLEVILSSDVMVYHVLRRYGVKFPEDYGFVSLRRSHHPGEEVITATDHQTELQGRSIVHMLHYLMQTHQRGRLPIPLLQLIEPLWHEGQTLA